MIEAVYQISCLPFVIKMDRSHFLCWVFFFFFRVNWFFCSFVYHPQLNILSCPFLNMELAAFLTGNLTGKKWYNGPLLSDKSWMVHVSFIPDLPPTSPFLPPSFTPPSSWEPISSTSVSLRYPLKLLGTQNVH